MSAVPEIHRHGWDLPAAGWATLDQDARVTQDCSRPAAGRRSAVEPGEETRLAAPRPPSSAHPSDCGDRRPVLRNLRFRPSRADDQRLEITWIVGLIVRLGRVLGMLMVMPGLARAMDARADGRAHVHVHGHVREHAPFRRADARGGGCARARGNGYGDVRGLHPSRVSLEADMRSAEYAMKRDRGGVATTWLATTASGSSAMDR